jgi:hypothetical protein
MFLFDFFKFLNTCSDGRAAAYMFFTIFVLLFIFTFLNNMLENVIKIFLNKKGNKEVKNPDEDM